MLVLLLQWGVPQVIVAGPSATGQASVTISNPPSILITEELEFGQVRPGGTAGTVVVTPQNNRFATGGTELSGSGSQHSRAEFEIEGPANAFFTIQLSSSPAEHDEGSNPSLEITDLVSFSQTLGIVTTTGKTDSDGEDEIFVGGTMQVPAGAKNGKYEGEVTLNVNF